jgi:hypothetical protein
VIEKLNAAITTYREKWTQLVATRQDKVFFESLQPTSVAWKAEDLADFDARFAELRDHADQIHFGWVNNRWLATVHLRDTALALGLTTVKLMQRRPGSVDATGLDHLDFHLDPQQSGSAKDVLAAEPDLNWNEENNGDHCKWLSIWFAGTEAKIRSDTVYDVCCSEMQEVNAAILSGAAALSNDAAAAAAPAFPSAAPPNAGGGQTA